MGISYSHGWKLIKVAESQLAFRFWTAAQAVLTGVVPTSLKRLKSCLRHITGLSRKWFILVSLTSISFFIVIKKRLSERRYAGVKGLFKALKQCMLDGDDSVLATVIASSGSTPVGPEQECW